MRGETERFILFDSGDLEAPSGDTEPVRPCSLAEAALGEDDEPNEVRRRGARPSLLDSLAGGVGGGLDFRSGIIRPTLEGEDERRAPLDCVSTVRPPFFDGLEDDGFAAAAAAIVDGCEVEISLDCGAATTPGAAGSAWAPAASPMTF
jgi:hypothetical protein